MVKLKHSQSVLIKFSFILKALSFYNSICLVLVPSQVSYNGYYRATFNLKIFFGACESVQHLLLATQNYSNLPQPTLLLPQFQPKSTPFISLNLTLNPPNPFKFSNQTPTLLSSHPYDFPQIQTYPPISKIPIVYHSPL